MTSAPKAIRGNRDDCRSSVVCKCAKQLVPPLAIRSCSVNESYAPGMNLDSAPPSYGYLVRTRTPRGWALAVVYVSGSNGLRNPYPARDADSSGPQFSVWTWTRSLRALTN